MSGKHPRAIVPDQDAAMGAAIERVFPETHHRLCMWHILKKESDKLGSIAKKESFTQPFYSCIWGSDTIEEFEEQWKRIMAENDLKDNDWLCSLYDIREQWVLVFFKHVFLAGIRTTQRSESVNAFIDKYVCKKNTLMEFIHHFERAMKQLRHNELKADFELESTKPSLVTPFNMETQMSATYSWHIFTNKFQVELLESTHCLSVLKQNDGPSTLYDIKMAIGKSLIREVEFYASQGFARCSCMMFESEGVPCRHILYVLRNNGIDTLPSELVLKRWTMSLTKEVVYDSHGTKLRGDHEHMPKMSDKRDKFYSIMSQCVKKACLLSDESLSALEEMLTNMLKLIEENTPKGNVSEFRDMSTMPTSIKVHNPNISKTKGSGKRLKSAKELAIEEAAKGGRLCHGCN